VKATWWVPLALSGSLAAALPAVAAGEGKQLYESKCAMCHGMDGVAKTMAAGSKNFNDPAWRKATTSALIAKILHDGTGKMKGLGDRLSAEQATAVADYVLSLAK
jgi:mono/diheme cytochrome c family protein